MIKDTKLLLNRVVSQFQLGIHSPHGASHWGRVKTNGFEIAKYTEGANLEVIELFAFFHDSRRLNDGYDPDHGERAIAFSESLRGEYFDLPDDDFELLSYACKHHTSGKTVGDITVQVCWDADRLDLGRVGVVPHPDYLCTDHAKRPDVIERALKRSRYFQEDEVILI